jgi:hypothetical protein
VFRELPSVFQTKVFIERRKTVDANRIHNKAILFLNPHCYWVKKKTRQPSCAIKIPVGKGKGKVHPRTGHEGPDGE